VEQIGQKVGSVEDKRLAQPVDQWYTFAIREISMSTLLNSDAHGVYVIAATPFSEDGAVDLGSIDRMIDFYLSCGVQGMTILGMMGEATKLSEEESQSVTRRILKRIGGRIPVVVGVSNPGIKPMVDFTNFVMAEGAAGVMVAPIPTLRTDEQIVNYFKLVCGSLGSEIPVVLQDYPLTTTVNFSVPAIERIIAECPQIVVLKHEDCPGLPKLTRIRQGFEKASQRRVSILVGNGGLYLPQELARGADGAMTGFAYPEMLVEVCDLFRKKNATAGEDLFDIYLPLLRHEAQPGMGLALRKEILRRRGAIQSSFVRAPGPKLTVDDHAELDRLISRLERKLSDQGRAKVA
jgi:4-hydroxy-tetrahydrodipicolinate synthase